jgi:esterase/lipase superfamily enzyme
MGSDGDQAMMGRFSDMAGDGRAWMRTLVGVLCVLVTLAGCAPRGSILGARPAPGTGSVQDIQVATTRARADRDDILSTTRSDTLNFFDFDVSVPPDRPPGAVVFPQALPPDPKTDFFTTAASQLDGPAAF